METVLNEAEIIQSFWRRGGRWPKAAFHDTQGLDTAAAKALLKDLIARGVIIDGDQDYILP